MYTLPKLCAALVTPLDARGAIDTSTLSQHCAWVLANGCDGAVLFGTTGEGPSFGLTERMRALEGLIADGIAPSALIVGTGCASIEDTAALTKHATDQGCAGTLIHPPFFFRPADDDGVIEFYSGLVDQLGSEVRNIVFYHFPEATGAGIGIRTIRHLLSAYPGVFSGIKDSSGDLSATLEYVTQFPELSVFTGDDNLLWPVLEAGGHGAITATANLLPAELFEISEGCRANSPSARAAQSRMELAWVETLLKLPVTQAVKEVLAHRSRNGNWRTLRPPLRPLSDADQQFLAARGETNFWNFPT